MIEREVADALCRLDDLRKQAQGNALERKRYFEMRHRFEESLCIPLTVLYVEQIQKHMICSIEQ